MLCAPITIERCNALQLPHQVQDNTSMLGTPFTVTVDLLEGCTTALQLLREKGEDALTARSLADALNCSTRPLFTLWANMDELKHDLRHGLALLLLCAGMLLSTIGARRRN